MRKIILIICFVFSFSGISFAANLDQPVQKKITLQSEMVRGNTAVLNVVNYRQNALEISDSIEKMVNKNVQNNTDTDGFYLGVYYQAWIHADSNYTASEKYISGTYKEYCNNLTELYYLRFRELQAKYELTDEELSKACGDFYRKELFDKYWEKIQKEKNK